MEDFLLLDNQLSPEERLSRDTVRQFIDEKVIEIMGDAVEKAHFPVELIPEMAKLGLFGATLPAQYGGSESNYVTYGLLCQELERGDSALRSFVSVQSSLCMFPIFKFGTEEQKREFLPKMAKGELIGCFGLTEPDAGSDPASMKTTAKKEKGGWRLNGSKLWITNATISDLAIVWAKTEQGVRGFIVEKGSDGFQRTEIKKKLSLRASNTGELNFTNCFVPDSHFLPGSEEGLSAALRCLTEARYGIAWGAMGAAMACYESALTYAKDRKQFNRAIASFQLIQSQLADMLIEIVKAQSLNLHLGRLKDKNQATFAMISLAKLNAAREALKIARQARNILGANGISLEYPVIRHMCNLESVFTYEGTDNIHHLILGKHITGIEAFS
jgi:glutaryl-CoA dehydrogenase